MIDERNALISIIRSRVKRVSLLFLFFGIGSPIILSTMIYILYKLETQRFDLILIAFSIIIPLQIIMSLFMYFRYKKIYDLSDEEFIKSTIYVNTLRDIYVKNYIYNEHFIQVRNDLNQTDLVVDGKVIATYRGDRRRNYKITGNFGDDKITAKYVFSYKVSKFIVNYNNIELNEIQNEN